MFGNNKDKNINKDGKAQGERNELDFVADQSMVSEEAVKPIEDNSTVNNETDTIGLDVNSAITGHGAFSVSIVPQGVAIHAGFIADGTKELMPVPAIFPNIESALVHIEDLRRLVIMHFGQIAAEQGAPLVTSDSNHPDVKTAP